MMLRTSAGCANSLELQGLCFINGNIESFHSKNRKIRKSQNCSKSMMDDFPISWDIEEWQIGSVISIKRIFPERESAGLWKSWECILSSAKRRKVSASKPEETAENKSARDFYAAAPNQKCIKCIRLQMKYPCVMRSRLICDFIVTKDLRAGM